MRYVSWEWFWYVVIGFLLGGVSVFAVTTLYAMGIPPLWYEWILGVLFILLFVFMGQTFIASLKEFEPRAAWMTLIFMGIPEIIIGVVLVVSVCSRG